MFQIDTATMCVNSPPGIGDLGQNRTRNRPQGREENVPGKLCQEQEAKRDKSLGPHAG